MAITIQDGISRKIWKWQRSMQDAHIKVSGTRAKVAVLDVVRDKYNNEISTFSIGGYVNVMMNFPDDEIPTSQWSTDYSNSSTNSNVLHMYDLLPIELYITYKDLQNYKITKDSIILYKIRNYDETFQTLALQVLDSQSKGNVSSGITWVCFNVAPITDYGLLHNDEFNMFREEFEMEDTWGLNNKKTSDELKVECIIEPPNQSYLEGEIINPITITCNVLKHTNALSKIIFKLDDEILQIYSENLFNDSYSFTYNKDISRSCELSIACIDINGNRAEDYKKINFTVPFYYGGVDEIPETFDNLNKDFTELGDSKEYYYTVNNQYIFFAYKSNYGRLAKILDDNGFNNTNDFITDTKNINGNLFRYYITHNKKTLNGFKYKFIFN